MTIPGNTQKTNADDPRSKSYQRRVLKHLKNALAKDTAFKRSPVRNDLIVAELRHWFKHRSEGAPLVYPSRATRQQWSPGVTGRTVQKYVQWMVKRRALIKVIPTPGGHGNPDYFWLDIGALARDLRTEGQQIGNLLIERLQALAEVFSHPSDLNQILQTLNDQKGRTPEPEKGRTQDYENAVSILFPKAGEGRTVFSQIDTTYLFNTAAVATNPRNEVLEATVAGVQTDDDAQVVECPNLETIHAPDNNTGNVSEGKKLRDRASGADRLDGQLEDEASLASPGQRVRDHSTAAPRKSVGKFAEKRLSQPQPPRVAPSVGQGADGSSDGSSNHFLGKNERAEASGSGGTVTPSERAACLSEAPAPRVTQSPARPRLVVTADTNLALSFPQPTPAPPEPDAEHAAALQRWTDQQNEVVRQAIEDWEEGRIPDFELWK